jgi:hypothetical protein
MSTITNPHPEPEEEADPVLAELSRKVKVAEQAMLGRMRESGGTSFPRELQKQAQDGLSASVMSIAFWRLLKRGCLTMDNRFHVSLNEPKTTASPDAG